jgi:molybdopterin-binding protein
MLKCNATVDLDVNKGIYTVTVSGDNGITQDYLFAEIEAREQKIYEDPEAYAAMKAIEIFVAQHEQKDA